MLRRKKKNIYFIFMKWLHGKKKKKALLFTTYVLTSVWFGVCECPCAPCVHSVLCVHDDGWVLYEHACILLLIWLHVSSSSYDTLHRVRVLCVHDDGWVFSIPVQDLVYLFISSFTHSAPDWRRSFSSSARTPNSLQSAKNPARVCVCARGCVS